MISVRTCNFWDSFCTVVPVLGFVLFFFPVKSPLLPGTLASTIVLSTQYSTSTSTSTFSTFNTCVCVCVCYCTYMKLHIHVCVCMYYVPRATYLLASCTDMCAHNTAVQNIVTCYCYLLRQCKLFTEAVAVYVYTEATFDCTTHS